MSRRLHKNIFLFIYILCLSEGAVFAQESIDTTIHDTTASSQRLLFEDTGYPKYRELPILNRKIFKGSRVTIAEHPYVVSIRRNCSHFLTGTILSKNIIITVAHPLFHVPVYELGVVCGENYMDRGTSILTILMIILHNLFDPYTLHHDVAIARIYEDLTYSMHIKPIPQLKDGMIDGYTAFVTGWGRCDWSENELCLPRYSAYFPMEKMDPMLRSTSFVLRQSKNYCEFYTRNGLTLPSNTLCVGVARDENPVAACLAVPGAPLAVNGHLLGLLSWGVGCGYANDLPLIYTDLRKYKDWLEVNVGILNAVNMSTVAPLFRATKAYTLSEILAMTRADLPPRHQHEDHTLVLSPVDEVLVTLRGRVFDIRDFMYHKKFHMEKKDLFAALKIKMIERYIDKSGTNNVSSPFASFDSKSELEKGDVEYYNYEYNFPDSYDLLSHKSKKDVMVDD